jgi:hypothetical protein
MADNGRHINGLKAYNTLFVLMQEAAARGEVVVDDVENLSTHAVDKASQHDCLGAVLDVGEWNGVRSAEMQEYSEYSQTHTTCDPGSTLAIDAARPDDDVWNTKVPRVVGDDLFLLDFSIAVSVPTDFWVLFNRAQFIQTAAPLAIGIYGERTDQSKPPKTSASEARIK